MSKILIIEDDLSIGEMMSDLLVRRWLSSEARGERPARRSSYFENFEPDIIMLDLMLPDMDGIQLCTDYPSHLDHSDSYGIRQK